MRIVNPVTGKTHDVTDRAFEIVYKRSGFIPVDELQAPDNDEEILAAAAEKDLQQQAEEAKADPDKPVTLIDDMTKKQIMAELKRLGVPFTDRAGVEELREQYRAAIY